MYIYIIYTVNGYDNRDSSNFKALIYEIYTYYGYEASTICALKQPFRVVLGGHRLGLDSINKVMKDGI